MNIGSNRLAGKTIIVTGGARGIGLSIAKSVASEGAIVIVVDIQEEEVRDACIQLEAAGYRAESTALDVRNEAAFTALADSVLTKHGQIDGLVNNAGINVKYSPLDMPSAEWDRCLDVNLRGAWNGCRAVLPHMIAKRSGSIVNMASVHGHQIIPGSFPYPVSKAGLLGMTRALGVEYAQFGVRVNSISPGYVETPLLDSWLASVPDPAKTRSEAEALIPSRRFAMAREVAMTAVFLLSDEAPSIIATDIAVDGGRMALFHQ
jgi:NAD(P)-dependent dehydrogenase (short-subunit alcohol dehydrogenase family)